jgi:serine/threonine-protein kinase RsbW
MRSAESSDKDARSDEPVFGQIVLALDPGPDSVTTARRAVDKLLVESQPSDEFRFSVRLVVSELMSNAIVHGSPDHPIDLSLTLDRGDVRIRIENTGVEPETTNVPGGRSEGGRGLQIVASLTEEWSIAGGRGATIATARVPASRGS